MPSKTFSPRCKRVVMKNGEEVTDPRIKNLEKTTRLMEVLGIPTHGDEWGYWSDVYAVDLYDILMDEEKFKALVSKVRNKAFW